MKPSAPLSTVARDAALARLPCELLNQIASFLPTIEFNNLRLTCKLVENKVFPYWSNAFFKKKQFMITAFSLQTLVDISRHATLGLCLTHLVIGLDHLQNIPGDFVEEDGENAYLQCHLASDSQEALLDTGAALQLLSTALVNLRNLKNIDIRDFNSNTRYRDYISTLHVDVPAWKSYGHTEVPPWSRYIRCAHNHGFGCVLIHKSSTPFVNRVFKVLLTAIGQSASPVRGLEVLLRNRYAALTGSAFAVTPILDSNANKLPIVLSRLTKLHLDVDLETDSLQLAHLARDDNHFSLDMSKSAAQVSQPSTMNLQKFLAMTPNITWLRLNSTKQANCGGTRFLSWLALDPEKPFGPGIEARWSNANPKPVSLPLRRLDLGQMQVNSKTLALICQKFDGLESLSLRGFNLESDKSHHDVDGDDDHGGVWARMLRKLLVFAPNLKYILLKDVRDTPDHHSRPYFSGERVHFALPGNGGNLFETTVELSVVSKASLEALADRTWRQDAWNAAQEAAKVSTTSWAIANGGLGDLGVFDTDTDLDEEHDTDDEDDVEDDVEDDGEVDLSA